MTIIELKFIRLDNIISDYSGIKHSFYRVRHSVCPTFFAMLCPIGSGLPERKLGECIHIHNSIS